MGCGQRIFIDNFTWVNSVGGERWREHAQRISALHISSTGEGSNARACAVVPSRGNRREHFAFASETLGDFSQMKKLVEGEISSESLSKINFQVEHRAQQFTFSTHLSSQEYLKTEEIVIVLEGAVKRN